MSIATIDRVVAIVLVLLFCARVAVSSFFLFYKLHETTTNGVIQNTTNGDRQRRLGFRAKQKPCTFFHKEQASAETTTVPAYNHAMDDFEYAEDKRLRREEEKGRFMVARNAHTFGRVTGSTEMMDDLQEADFCMANLPTFSMRHGHARSLLHTRCASIWNQPAFRLEQVCDRYSDAGTKSSCRMAVAGATRSQHEPKEAEWHLPVDSDTLDDAFHPCGLHLKQSSEWTGEERYNRNRAEWAMVCRRNEESPMPGGAGVAIRRSCANSDNKNALILLAGQRGVPSYTRGSCLGRHIVNQKPGQRGHPTCDAMSPH
nr:hypothetical protein [Pandoravirus massiliensis]